MKKGPWSKFRASLVLSLLTVSGVVSAESASLYVARASDAVVLIKAHLKHGLLEDDEAEGR